MSVETRGNQGEDQVPLELLEEIMAAFNSRDPDRIASHFADDAEFVMASGETPDGRIVKGRDQIREVLAKRFERIPDMSWDPQYDYVAGNRAVSVWYVKGHADDGTVLNYRGCDLWEFEGDKVVHKDTYWKIVKS